MSDKNKIYILGNEENKDYLKNYSFYIPNSQRGYKWSKENIEDLLNDINSIGKDAKKDHCLHNLTIIEINEKHSMYNLTVEREVEKNDNKINYEVVDGQQRLTTIFLLLKYLGYKEIYNLDYQIRDETKDFIENKITDVINLIKYNKKTKDIFSNLVENNKNYNKQDIYFICDVLFYMHQWFTDNTDNKIYDNLQNVYFYMSDDNKIYILGNEENKDYLKNYSFYIPNYQRGYKWSEKNIKDLLNDINSIDNDNKKDHCLHNLTIIEKNGKYEVVDGQQRLTTIFLLLKYLGYGEIYNLDYQIREKTRDLIYNKNNEFIGIIEKIKNNKKTKDIFSNLVKNNNNYNKQDIYFICDALFCMHQWFINSKNNNPQNFENLEDKIKNNLENVYFYKHKLTGIKGETVFANLNSGRVPLTDIELIKADLIISISEEKNKSKDNDILLNEIRSNIGRLWDEMESFLAQDEVWYWIAANNKSANKLSLLFDLIDIKDFKNYKDILANEDKKKTSNDILNKIKDYYYTIKDWYYDNDMYHLVGIAVNIGISIKDLLPKKTDDGEYKLKNKKELKNKIIESIIEELKIYDTDSIKIGETQYEDLNYQNNSKDIEKIMLLLNCLEGYNFKNKTFNKVFRYRFDLHNKEQWSIEHIFPQNATKENYKSYILDLICLFKEENKEELKSICGILGIVNNNNENIDELKNLIIEKLRVPINEKKENDDEKEYIDINKINEISNKIVFDIQKIGNLALLSKNINSSLQNYIFEEKRTILLKKISEENIFVPPLTLKIFSKNFDEADRTKAYWTPTDFNAYINYQKAQLKEIIKLIEDKK